MVRAWRVSAAVCAACHVGWLSRLPVLPRASRLSVANTHRLLSTRDLPVRFSLVDCVRVPDSRALAPDSTLVGLLKDYPAGNSRDRCRNVVLTTLASLERVMSCYRPA
jgi:hypothetical protein